VTYVPTPDRYTTMLYGRCGASGLQLPAVSLGLRHNFGHDRTLEQDVAALDRLKLELDEFVEINRYATDNGINLRAASSGG
jgi:L-glyceraldehyde 3-phosphate reductase